MTDQPRDSEDGIKMNKYALDMLTIWSMSLDVVCVK